MTTDTPLVDAFIERFSGSSKDLSDFARTLERDLSECRAALREIVTTRGDLDGAHQRWIDAPSGSRIADYERLAAHDAHEIALANARAILAKGDGK